MSTENGLRNFLALPYDELEQLNLKAKEQRKNRVAVHKIQEERLKYCLLYTSPSPRDLSTSRMPSSA